MSTRTAEQVRKEQAATPAGRLLAEMGWDYYDTESAARRVAEFSAAKIDKLSRESKRLRVALRKLDRTLAVSAAEYVPAMADALKIISDVRKAALKAAAEGIQP